MSNRGGFGVSIAEHGSRYALLADASPSDQSGVIAEIRRDIVEQQRTRLFLQDKIADGDDLRYDWGRILSEVTDDLIVMLDAWWEFERGVVSRHAANVRRDSLSAMMEIGLKGLAKKNAALAAKFATSESDDIPEIGRQLREVRNELARYKEFQRRMRV